ncbi:Hypp8682 [Branchiostoma lanceolatum]|uniref:Hypp8682 protein n=1 Tax=Branchiostoma lanceolatum TaxID=7740 RepID=A0A8K0EEA1_BRALA|nr:Hypp8682 [Branchiostoma lanceolatum]
MCSSRSDSSTEYHVWLHHDTLTQHIFPKTEYDYICGKLLFSSRVIIRSQTYRSPFVIMFVTEGTEHGNNVIPWCRRFWLGGDTASVNVAASKASTVELATISVRENNRTVRLVSAVFDSTPSAEMDAPDVDSANSTKNVTCVLVRGNKVTRSFLTATERRKPDTNVHRATGEDIGNNTTSPNKTGDVREESWPTNITDDVISDDVITDDVNIIDDVSSTTNSTTQSGSTITLRPQPKQGQYHILAIAISAAATLTAVAIIYIVIRRVLVRHGDETAEEDAGNYCKIPDDAIDPLARPVATISNWMIPNRRYGNDVGATVIEAEEGEIPAAYWEIPDDYFDFNNPGYRHRCSSLPTDENSYWQISDEYYCYENTARQANWRPSSLPLTLDVTYENLRQDENVERFQW